MPININDPFIQKSSSRGNLLQDNPKKKDLFDLDEILMIDSKGADSEMKGDPILVFEMPKKEQNSVELKPTPSFRSNFDYKFNFKSEEDKMEEIQEDDENFSIDEDRIETSKVQFVSHQDPVIHAKPRQNKKTDQKLLINSSLHQLFQSEDNQSNYDEESEKFKRDSKTQNDVVTQNNPNEHNDDKDDKIQIDKIQNKLTLTKDPEKVLKENYVDFSNSQNLALAEEQFQKMVIKYSERSFGEESTDLNMLQRQSSLVYFIFMANLCLIAFLVLLYLKLSGRISADLTYSQLFIPLELSVLLVYGVLSSLYIHDFQSTKQLNVVMSVLIIIMFVSLELSLLFLGIFLNDNKVGFQKFISPAYICYIALFATFIYILPGLFNNKPRVAILGILHMIGLFSFLAFLEAKYEHQTNIYTQVCLIPLLASFSVHFISANVTYFCSTKTESKEEFEVVIVDLILIEIILVILYLECILQNLAVAFLPVSIALIYQFVKFVEYVTLTKNP
ncbi:UNKNOWN [Stylonychia lemnae]|uniref:Transmembrane protein n=1 Tax=Stylonychia lemnae TaxID=5949 RepID=A0A078ABG3_STYLE|nr:UNKNOWN [Stylonychia lemnae]|eukprot:CDW79211.1 UNKNOWN [Stylonychia lemnae]